MHFAVEPDYSAFPMTPTDLINKGSVPYSDSNNNSMAGSLADIWFPFMLKNILSVIYVDLYPSF